jgi:hypothetical protein
MSLSFSMFFLDFQNQCASFFCIPRFFNWFTGCVADDQAEKQLFGAYLHVLKSRVDDVWWEKNHTEKRNS